MAHKSTAYNDPQANKLYVLNTSILSTLLSAEIGDQDVKVDCHVNREEADELGVSIYRHRFYHVVMTSAALITETEVRRLIVRCFDKKDDLSGAEYEQLADYLSQGKYVRKDYYGAHMYYLKAVDKGQHSAVVKTFQCSAAFDGDWDHIYRKYLWACSKGMTEHEFLTSPPEVVEAVKQESLAAKGDVTAVRALVRFYKAQNRTDRFRNYMKRLAELGERDAILFMSELAFNRSCNLSKKVRDIHWHEKAAALGCAEALYRLGRIKELLAKADKSQLHSAIGYHEKAAERGIVESMYRLSRLYGNAESPYYDQTKSDFYLAKAYEFGHPLALRQGLDFKVRLGA